MIDPALPLFPSKVDTAETRVEVVGLTASDPLRTFAVAVAAAVAVEAEGAEGGGEVKSSPSGIPSSEAVEFFLATDNTGGSFSPTGVNQFGDEEEEFSLAIIVGDDADPAFSAEPKSLDASVLRR